MTKTNPKKHPLLIVILVIMESILSIALRLDKGLRQRIYPLVQDNMVWCIRTYLPHVMIYASFTQNGILLDSKQPEDVGEPDVIISGSLMAVVRAVLSTSEQNVRKLQFRGDDDKVLLSQECLNSLGMQRVLANVMKSVNQFNTPEQAHSQKTELVSYKKQVEEQQTAIDNLSAEVASLHGQIIGYRKRQLGFMTISAVLLIVLVGVVVMNYV